MDDLEGIVRETRQVIQETRRDIRALSDSVYATWVLPRPPRRIMLWRWLLIADTVVLVTVLAGILLGAWRPAVRVADSWTWISPDSGVTYLCTAADGIYTCLPEGGH